MIPDPLARFLGPLPSLEPLGPALARAAESDSPILILGPPGSGRTRLAHTLHQSSRRGSGTLVEVDPAAIPASLFESELFGYDAGAFTGASQPFPGRVGQALGGSLLFDHVEETPLSVQGKLLRLLSEGRFAPLGGRERAADVRFLAIGATSLHDRVVAGLFREDLYYRLEVLTFILPPLRDRPEDLLPLARSILRDLSARFGKQKTLEIDDEALAWMRGYDWPGNVRELRNVLERALLASDSDRICPVPPQERRAAAPRSLAECEREAIRAALAYSRGHTGKAAEILGISRKSLWERRRRLGLP